MEELLLSESSFEEDYVRVYRNETITHDSEYKYVGKTDSIEFRREFTDIKEEDIISIPMKDIPKLVDFLNKQLRNDKSIISSKRRTREWNLRKRM